MTTISWPTDVISHGGHWDTIRENYFAEVKVTESVILKWKFRHTKVKVAVINIILTPYFLFGKVEEIVNTSCRENICNSLWVGYLFIILLFFSQKPKRPPRLAYNKWNWTYKQLLYVVGDHVEILTGCDIKTCSRSDFAECLLCV